jgi:superfamily II DNA or RNA helicase
MTSIRINNDFSYLLTNDSDLLFKLWGKMRWRQRNYFHTKLYKQRLWDGYVDFFNKKSGRFLTGLLPEVIAALKYWNVDYTIVDERQFTKFLYDKIDCNFLNKWLPKGEEPIILEDYQVALVNQAIKYSRGIIKAPTGSGKTYGMLAIMKALPKGTPILFLANRKSLINQNYKEMLRWGFENVGRFDGDHHEPNIITCATLQSLHHLEKILHKFRVVIVDEIHMMMSAKAIKIYKKLTNTDIRIGVSATPFKFQKRKKSGENIEGDKVHKYSVKGYFGPVLKTDIVDLTTELLQNRGRLSKSKCIFYPIDEPQIPYDIYIDAVTNGIAQSWHFHQVVKNLANKLTGRTLILVERLAHGDTLHQLIPGSLWIRGEDNSSTREHVINKLQKSTENTIAIATVGIFNTGINIRSHAIINAAGGKASHEIIQRIGRGLRPSEDKDILHYYDFIFRINKYLEEHSMDRIRILQDEGHEIIIKDRIDFLL